MHLFVGLYRSASFYGVRPHVAVRGPGWRGGGERVNHFEIKSRHYSTVVSSVAYHTIHTRRQTSIYQYIVVPVATAYTE